MVNGKVYSGKKIPHEKFKEPIRNSTSEFFLQLTINDLTLNVPHPYNMPDIRILKAKDTMHLYTAAINRPDAVALKWAKGYYYLPSWAASFMKNEFITISHPAKLINSGQNLFRIPAADYFALFQKEGRDENPLAKITRAQWLSYQEKDTIQKFINEVPGYNEKQLEDKIYPSFLPDIDVAVIRYGNSIGDNDSKYLVSFWNKKANTIEHLLPFGVDTLHWANLMYDKYNNQLLAVVGSGSNRWETKRYVYQLTPGNS